MKKIFVLFLLISILFSAVSCNVIPDNTVPDDVVPDDGQDNNEPEETGWIDKAPWNGTKFLSLGSYNDLISAWEIINETTEKPQESYYILPDDLGDKYTMVYRLEAQNLHNHNMNKPPVVHTAVLLYLNDTSFDMCQCKGDRELYYAYHADLVTYSDPEREDRLLENLLLVRIYTTDYTEIKDRSLLSIRKSENAPEYGYPYSSSEIYMFKQAFTYDLMYGNKCVAILSSCIELDNEVTDLVINNVCGLYDLKG